MFLCYIRAVNLIYFADFLPFLQRIFPAMYPLPHLVKHSETRRERLNEGEEDGKRRERGNEGRPEKEREGGNVKEERKRREGGGGMRRFAGEDEMRVL